MTSTTFFQQLEKFKMSQGNIEDFYPLSPMQQGMLFHTLYSPNSGVYFEQLTCALRKLLNAQAFKQAWQQVTDRHPILRTGFVSEGVKEPVQVVHRKVQLPWEEYDWSSLSPVDRQQQLEIFLKADRDRGFDLLQPPLMRLTLIKLEKDAYYFIWSHHHLLLDGWSTPAILKEVFDFYQAFLNGEQLSLPKPRPYRDYIVWIQQQNLSEAESFWRDRLQGFSAPTSIEIERDFDTVAEASDREQQILLSTATTAALRAIARGQQLTLNTLVQGAWGLLLSRYSGEEDVVFGAVVSGRPPELAGVESMVGLFVNTLPVRVKIRPEDTLLSWLKQLQDRQIEARQYEYSPLMEVQRCSEVPPGLPLFDTLVVFENYPLESSLQERVEALEIESVRSFEKTNYALTLTVVPGAELALKIAYYSSRFDDRAIARMLGHLQTLLAEIAANPHQKLSHLPLLSAAEQQQLLVEWNNTKSNYPKNTSLCELFETEVERSPSAVAAICGNEQLTYRELNAKANKIAHYLQSLGVGTEVLVGIYLERSLLTIVGILAILKAGAAYLPLDPAYPQDRFNFMLQDAEISVLLTQKKLQKSLFKNIKKVVCIDGELEEITQQSESNPTAKVEPDSLAYVLYTSGSTGTPKGVLGTHQGTINRCYWNPYSFSEGDICCQKTSLNFVDSIWEILAPLLHGLPTVIIPDEAVKDIHRFVQTLSDRNVTRLVLVPSLLRSLLDSFADLNSRLPKLKYWICSGEILSVELSQQFREQMPDRVLINLYGSSEVAADVTWYDVSKGVFKERVPIGRAIANTQIYLLDRNLQPVPVGIPGEIYVGGDGLARGYLNRPKLTAEKFIANPFWKDKVDDSARFSQKILYKTGDLGCYLPDGNIEFLGRIDRQVKLRGFRIELGEIERVLSQHSLVREAAVLLLGNEPENQRLVAYLVPNSTFSNQNSELILELRSFLKQKLAYYMVPNDFVLLEELPLTPNGKLDFRALSERRDRPSEETAFAAPQTPTEREIAEIWTAVLGIEKVGIHESFFDLGGHSLKATQLVSRVRSRFGIELSLSDFFAFPTIQEMAEMVEEAILAIATSEQIDELLDRLEEVDEKEAQKIAAAERIS